MPITLRINVRCRWWLQPSLALVGAVALMIGYAPVERLAHAIVRHGVVVTVASPSLAA